MKINNIETPKPFQYIKIEITFTTQKEFDDFYESIIKHIPNKDLIDVLFKIKRQRELELENNKAN